VIGVVSAILGANVNAPAGSVEIVYADIFNPRQANGSIRTASLLGKMNELLVDTGGGLRGIAYDPVEQMIYWTDVDNFAIRRARSDGSCVETIISSGLGFPSAIDVDPVGRKIYWGDQADKMQALWRANLDGSEAELIVPTAFHRGVQVDPVGGKVYWTTSTTQFKGAILRANLDGTDVETVISSLDAEFKPADIALDLEGGFIYWTDYVVDIVRRASPESPEHIETLFIPPFNNNPRGIAIDLQAGHVYWGQDTDIITINSDLMRMNLNGSNPIVVLDDVGLVNSIILRETPPELCAGDFVDSATFAPPPDGSIDAADLAYLLGAWGAQPSCADMVSSDTFEPPPDGNVDAADLAFLLGNWGLCE
jgi:DNA-binding beta-propeller fold protein YncE